MASCDFLCLCQVRALTQGFIRSPHAAQAHQRYSRCWCRASFAYLIEQRSPVDKVRVATERHEARGLWWSLRALCKDGAVSSAFVKAEASTCRQEHGSGSRCGQSC